MKVLSVLFLGLLLFAAVVDNSAFATDYLSTWTTVRKSCDKPLELLGPRVTWRPTNCVELDPELEEVLNKTSDYFSDDPDAEDANETIIEYELVKKSTGFFYIRVRKCYFARQRLLGCDPPVDTLLEVASPLALQKLAPGAIFPDSGKTSMNGSSAAIPNRIFTTGPNTTALKNDYVAYALDPEDFPTSAKRVIFANPSTKTALGASAAPDGGMAVQLIADSSTWTMSTRRLKNGLPIAAPFTWTVPAYTGYSPDITNAIEVSSGAAGASAVRIRYLVFRAFRNVGTTSQQSQVMIQIIDDATGKPMGPAKALTNFAKAFQAGAEAIQSIAIAPDGKFMLFTLYSDACKRQILKFVKLVNGAVSGAATTTVNCAGLAATPGGVVGVDIMQAELAPSESSK